MALKITYHAAERFLQRVFEFTSYTKDEVYRAMQLIAKDVVNIEHRGKSFVLPTFPNFVAIVKENALVTILPKRW